LLKKLNQDPIFSYIKGEKNKNFFLLFVTIFFAVLAGLMEGLSYGGILLAVNVLKGDPIYSLPIFSFLLKYIKLLSANRQFLFFIIFSLFIQFIRSGFLFLSQYIVSKLSLKISTVMQHKIYKQIFTFTFPFVSKYQAGDLINYNTSPNVIPVLLSQLNNALSSLVLGIISLFWLIKIDIILTFFLLFFFFSVNFFYKLILKKMTSLSSSLTEEEVKFSSQTNQNINGIKLIHMFNKQNYIVDKTKDILNKIAKSNTQLTFWRTLIMSFGEIIGIVVIGLMLIFGAFLLRHKASFISSLLIFIFIAYRLSTRLQMFMNCIGEILSYKGPLKRLKQILKDEDKEYIPSKGLHLKKFLKSIKFKNVSFIYKGRKKPALKKLTLSFNKGKTYAIIGKSGAGKSTLIDLLLNLYQPTRGNISVDNIDLNKISLKSWREKIGIVNQDIFLFHDSIESNIKFGYEKATQNEIITAAKLANAEEFISRLPKKYETIVGEKGHKLSGGERQRIALARALIKNPDILILDEATSQLDSHSEKLIQNAIETLRKEKTLIIIAHRLSTIVNADEILVINEGQLVEKGPHHDLIQKTGYYSYFWSIQSKSKKQTVLNNEF